MIRKLALLAGAALIAKKWWDRPQYSQVTTGGAPTGSSGLSSPGHHPTDLAGDRHPDGSVRADDHFRPDPTGTVSPEDRESLRPVTMPAPHDPPGR